MCDAPIALKQQLQQAAIFHLRASPLDGTSPEIFEHIPGVRNFTHRPQDGYATLEFILKEEDVLAAVVNQLMVNDIHLLHLEKREPSLEDVFIHFVGRSDDSPLDERPVEYVESTILEEGTRKPCAVLNICFECEKFQCPKFKEYADPDTMDRYKRFIEVGFEE